MRPDTRPIEFLVRRQSLENSSCQTGGIHTHDPGFVPRVDPPLDIVRVGRGGQVPAFLLCRFGLMCRAVLEPEAVVPGFEDVAMMGEPVEQGGRHLCIAEHAGPFTEAEVGGDDDAGVLVELAQ